jgi:1-deoxy-D-xylulose-5-phosphate synthase
MHSTGVIDPQTGLFTAVAAPGWTLAFAESLIKYAKKCRDIVAITAAMPGPTGLTAFRQRFPDRFSDVGIAEQHAMTSAGGLAMGGLHPVVAIDSTFLNRAFDQIMMDVALHKLPVTVVLDRSGVTGSDVARQRNVELSCSASCRACGWRRRATRRGCARNSVRHSTSVTARPPFASRKVM